METASSAAGEIGCSLRVQCPSLSPAPSDLSPLRSSGDHSQWLFQKTIGGFELLIAQSMAELLGAQWGIGPSGEHKHTGKAFLSLLQSLLADRGSPEKTCYHCCDTNSVLSQKCFNVFFLPMI